MRNVFEADRAKKVRPLRFEELSEFFFLSYFDSVQLNFLHFQLGVSHKIGYLPVICNMDFLARMTAKTHETQIFQEKTFALFRVSIH